MNNTNNIHGHRMLHYVAASAAEYLSPHHHVRIIDIGAICQQQTTYCRLSSFRGVRQWTSTILLRQTTTK